MVHMLALGEKARGTNGVGSHRLHVWLELSQIKSHDSIKQWIIETAPRPQFWCAPTIFRAAYEFHGL